MTRREEGGGGHDAGRLGGGWHDEEGGGRTMHARWWLIASGGGGRGCTQDLEIEPQIVQNPRRKIGFSKVFADRMIASGVDGLSRGNYDAGISLGFDICQFHAFEHYGLGDCWKCSG
jgi:hypothetical protein